jgi:hypothetical protein
MVHALEEIQRTLIPNGVLIDLRPLLDKWSLQAISGQTHYEIGRLTDLPAGLADDEAANNAIMEASRRGWFILEGEQSYPLFYYWDTPEEMREHLQENWSNFSLLEDRVYTATQDAWEALGTDRRVGIQLKMHLSRWRKR